MQAANQPMETGSVKSSRMIPGEVIEHYRRNDFFCGLKVFAFDLNGLLRHSCKLTEPQAEAVRLLDAAIAEAPVSESNLVFFRGCSETDYLLCDQNEEFLSWSFLSLSKDPMEAARFATSCSGEPSYLLMVVIPAGTPLLRISDDAAGSLENDEWLPARGLRFRSYPWDGTSGVRDEDIWGLHFRVPHARNRRLELIS